MRTVLGRLHPVAVLHLMQHLGIGHAWKKMFIKKYLYADSPRAPAPEDGNPAYASGGPAPQLRIEHVWKQQFSADSP